MTEVALPASALAELDRPAWKTALSWLGAVLTALLFLTSGIWKITDLPRWSVMLHQFKVPENLTLASAFLLGVSETLAGVLILVPRFRRWGSWLASLLLVVFMVYVGIFYGDLAGKDCSCFPIVKRAVNPMFFVEDAGMLLLAVIAGLWARKPEGLRTAGIILGAIAVFAGVSLGLALGPQKTVIAPAEITVEGKPFSLQEGKIYIFFFDPECLHCLEAARKMAKMNWGDTRIVVVPARVPQFAHDFLHDAKLSGAGVSNDLDLLKKTFPYVSTPAAVAIEDGREKAMISQFGDVEPEATLKKLHFIY
jgi:uncharacterized membrane protein YphA (DoxX/SURF4 family)